MDKYDDLLSRAKMFHDQPMIGELMNAVRELNERPDVVKCRECKNWNEDAMACDTLPWVNSSEHAIWYADDFCSYGERRKDE